MLSIRNKAGALYISEIDWEQACALAAMYGWQPAEVAPRQLDAASALLFATALGEALPLISENDALEPWENRSLQRFANDVSPDVWFSGTGRIRLRQLIALGNAGAFRVENRELVDFLGWRARLSAVAGVIIAIFLYLVTSDSTIAWLCAVVGTLPGFVAIARDFWAHIIEARSSRRPIVAFFSGLQEH